LQILIRITTSTIKQLSSLCSRFYSRTSTPNSKRAWFWPNLHHSKSLYDL